jgi:hypothetical protein
VRLRFFPVLLSSSLNRLPPHSRNLVAGTKYLEVVGDLVVTTSLSSAQATISFIEGSAWGGSSTRNKIAGKVTDDRGNVVTELVGRWDDAVDKKEGGKNFTRLWQMGESPPSASTFLFIFFSLLPPSSLLSPFLFPLLSPLLFRPSLQQTQLIISPPSRPRTLLRFLPLRPPTQRAHPHRRRFPRPDRFSSSTGPERVRTRRRR